jgi:hypothetical protein
MPAGEILAGPRFIPLVEMTRERHVHSIILRVDKPLCYAQSFNSSNSNFCENRAV